MFPMLYIYGSLQSQKPDYTVFNNLFKVNVKPRKFTNTAQYGGTDYFRNRHSIECWTSMLYIVCFFL